MAQTDNGVQGEAAAPTAEHRHEADNCLFCKLVRGEIPSRKVYEDEHAFAFHDINPSAPVHFLIVPKQHIVNLIDGAEHPALLGHLFSLCNRLAKEQGATDGFRTIVNSGPGGGQEVYHLHIHVLGGAKLPHPRAAA